MKLKVSPVTSSHRPHTMNDARWVSTRGALPRSTIPATSRISAAGISQAI